MSTVRLTPPPIQVDANDFTFKKWFQEVYQYSQGGVLIPTVDSTIQQYGGYRNLLINGSFQINQRAANSYNNAAGTSFTVDRWAVGARAANSYSVVYPVAGPPGFAQAVQVIRNVGDTSAAEIFFVNMSESKNSVVYAGKTIVLSFWLKCGTGFSGTPMVNSPNGETLESHVQSGTGTDEGALAALTGGTFVVSGYIRPTTTWTYYQFSGTVPSNSNELKTYFGWTPAASATTDDCIYLAGVQVEIARDQLNPIATAFEYIPFDVELARCKRYYQKSFAYGVVPGQNTLTLNGALVYQAVLAGIKGFTPMVYLPVAMRQNVSPTYYNYGASNGKWRNFSLSTDSGSPTTSSQGPQSFGVLNPQVAADAQGNFMVIHWSCETELI